MLTFARLTETAVSCQGWPQSSLRFVHYLKRLWANGEISSEELDFLTLVAYL